MKERTNSVSRGREKCAKILMQLQNTHLSLRLPTTKTLVPCQINSFHYNKGNHNIIYIIMEVLPKTFDPARIGAHSLFADPVPFAGPTGSPMISSK